MSYYMISKVMYFISSHTVPSPEAVTQLELEASYFYAVRAATDIKIIDKTVNLLL
jgi:hypothetical protein